MTVASDLADAYQALAAAVADTAYDPADRVRLLTALAVQAVPVGGNATVAALGRRAALAALARATTDYRPRSYDEAVALRDSVCGLLQDEELRAADAWEDDVVAALRTLRGAVDRDLTRRGASLSPLRSVEVQANLPALALANRLYGDGSRTAELAQMAGDPPHPCFMPRRFRALAR